MADENAHLSRREMRERERAAAEANPSSEDLLAAELERQLAPFRTEEALNPSGEVPRVEAEPDVQPVAEAPIPAQPAELPPVAEAASVAKPVSDKAPRRPKKSRRSGPPTTPVVPAKLVDSVSTNAPARRSGTKAGARIFSWVAIALIAGLALATSVPATALMTPEQRAYQAELDRIKASGQNGDVQTLLAQGAQVAQANRDGVTIGGAVKSSNVNYVGAYSDKKLKVSVPMSSNAILWPFASGLRVTDHYGSRFIFGSTQFHTGQDFDMAYGTPVHAIADGVVTYVEDPGPMCGASITIDSNINGNQFSAVYCHNQVGSMPFKAGDTVKAGDVVSKVGLTGITTGPHLHLEVRVRDQPIDPWPFLIQYAGNPPY